MSGRRARPQDSTLGGAAGAVNIAITEVATAQQLGDVLQVRTA
jgi:hypothetical protein